MRKLTPIQKLVLERHFESVKSHEAERLFNHQEHFEFCDKIDELKANNDTDMLREILKEVELAIKQLAGTDPIMKYRNLSDEEKKMIEDLLGRRQKVLDNMFTATPDEVEQFKKVNELLLRLTNKMYNRTANLSRLFLENCLDSDFDDDIEVKGSLICDAEYYENEELLWGDTKKYENDNYYGSDFSYMEALIFTSVQKNESLVELSSAWVTGFDSDKNDFIFKKEGCTNELDDGTSWQEGKKLGNALDNICWCHATHSLINHNRFSIPDMLRLNSFEVQVNIVDQHMINQDGKRWKELI